MRVLWIGAHPDDELFVAPWLAKLRITAGAKLGFLLASRGERGACRLPSSGDRDLATLREKEMRDAATAFDGELRFLGWRDGTAAEPSAVIRTWAREAGGKKALRNQLRSAITSFSPDWIVTFDRRHGCTWHADHRAIGILVQSLALAIPVTLAESRITFSAPMRIESGSRHAEAVHVSETWNDLLLDVACHPSQFSAETIELFRNVPDEERVVWLLHAPAWPRWSYLRDNVIGSLRRIKSFVRDQVRRTRRS